MKITPHHLAALADAAIPGVEPIAVHVVAENVGERFHVGFVIDSQERAWVVRLPGDAVSAALQDASVAFLEEIERYLPYDVPRPAGFAACSDGRRAMVYPYLNGRLVDFALLPAGPGIATGIGEALAALHDVPVPALDETGVPVYDAEECRHRLLSDVDRGARTGLVPSGLLTRWESILDDVSWWRFVTVPVHGYLSNAHLLTDFPTEDTSSGRVSALVSWEGAKIGDPAEDLAAIARSAPPEAVDTVFGAYAQHRREPVDPHLRERARLLGELRLLSRLLSAHHRDDGPAVEHAVAMLRKLASIVDEDSAHQNDPSGPRTSVSVSYEDDPAEEDWYSSVSRQAFADEDRTGAPVAEGTTAADGTVAGPPAPAPAGEDRGDAGHDSATPLDDTGDDRIDDPRPDDADEHLGGQRTHDTRRDTSERDRTGRVDEPGAYADDPGHVSGAHESHDPAAREGSGLAADHGMRAGGAPAGGVEFVEPEPRGDQLPRAGGDAYPDLYDPTDPDARVNRPRRRP